MKEYHKIETLFKFNNETKKFNNDEFYNPTVELLKNHGWLFTEKIDGTNFRIMWDGHKLTFGGRTNNATFSKVQLEFIENNLVNEDIERTFEQLFMEKNVIVYGELYGKGIQKDGDLYVDNDGLSFKVFDIEINDIFLTYTNMKEVATNLGYNYVPLVLQGTIQEAIDYVLKTDKSTFSNANLEGLVGKPLGDLRDRLGKRIVVKIKKRDLLKG